MGEDHDLPPHCSSHLLLFFRILPIFIQRHRMPLLAFNLRKTQLYLNKFSGSAWMTRFAQKPVEMKNWTALYAGNLLALWRMYLMSYDVAIPCAKIVY